MKGQIFHMGIALLIGSCIFVALVVLVTAIWRKSGIGGFGLLALLLLLDRIASFALPFALVRFSPQLQRTFEVYFNVFMFALPLIAWWQIYLYFNRAAGGASQTASRTGRHSE